MLTRQLGKMLGLAARRPSAIPALIRWKPFSITSFEMATTLRDQGLRPRTIIDGGANVGQFARASLETFYDAQVISFEPLPAAAAGFRDHLSGETRCQLIEKALGDTDGTISFHPQTYDLASSVLPPVGGGVPEILQVPVTRLDTALDGEALNPRVLLKLDLQGYELTALQGARKTLKRVDWVLLETAFKSSYQGEAQFEELFDFLRESGFRFLRPIDFLRTTGGEIVQMDALFERTG